MSRPQLIPIPQGTHWFNGRSIDIALLSLTIVDLEQRLDVPFVGGVEDGLGSWTAVAGRLPSCGELVELIVYARLPHAILRTTEGANYTQVLDEVLAVLGLTRGDAKSIRDGV